VAPKSDQPIIIKKKKAGHAGAHGGSWKVAYADFVTAMMAFFLLMWLVSMSTPQVKENLSKYFNEYDIFKGSASLFEGAGGTTAVNVAEEQAPPGPEVRAKVKAEEKKPTEELNPEEIEQKLNSIIELKLGDMKDQLSVDRVPDGVRIQLIYKEGRPLFEAGQASLTETGRDALLVLGQAITGLPNAIVVEGHTDAAPLNRVSFDNWDLSVDRALAAMHYLVATGIDGSRVARVAGLEARQPLIPENPLDPRNRRISIFLLNKPKPKDTAPKEPPPPDFKVGEEAPAKPKAKPEPAKSSHDLAP
jgi:chemotaxis protein MotB